MAFWSKDRGLPFSLDVAGQVDGNVYCIAGSAASSMHRASVPSSPHLSGSSSITSSVHRVPKSAVNVLKRIGEGAFGEVSLALCATFGKVAVKWLKVRLPGKMIVVSLWSVGGAWRLSFQELSCPSQLPCFLQDGTAGICFQTSTLTLQVHICGLGMKPTLPPIPTHLK